MIGDLSINAKIKFAKRNQPLTFGQDGAIRINVTGLYATEVIVLSTTGDNTVALGDVSTIGYVGVTNIGASLIDSASSPTVTPKGTPGTNNYSYAIVAKQRDGGYNVASSDGTTSTGNATLNVSNFNTITWSKVDDAVSYDVYRTATDGTPNTTGLISNILAPILTVDDIGLGAQGEVAPSTTPYDFTAEMGADGANYPILIKGGDTHLFRWNDAAIHHKTIFNDTNLLFLIVDS